MDWSLFATCIATIASGIISGLFTFLGVLWTLKKERTKEINEQRPNLVIEDFYDIHPATTTEKYDYEFFLTRPIKINSETEFFYDKEDLKRENWQCVTYKLKNIGKTSIRKIRVSTDCIQKTTIFEINEFKNYVNVYHEPKFYVYVEQMIRPKDTFILRICFSLDKIKYSTGRAYTGSLWLTDSYNSLWRQIFKFPFRELDDSLPVSEKDFNNNIDLNYFEPLY